MNLSIFRKALCLILFISSVVAFGQSQTQNVSPGGTKFLLYTPASYNASTPTPLLISLHGGGEIGDDLTKLTTGTPHLLPSKLISQGATSWPASRPFIVVSPQLKRDLSIPNYNDQEWPATLVNEVVEYVRANYNIDANKIYLTGISLGAAGGWDYITAYPNKVAAFVPISGKTRPENACIVKNTPIWAFHGEVDALVKPQFTVDMINAINACSPAGTYKTRLNLLHAKAHEGWSEVYNGTQGYPVFDWLLKFVKGNNANKTPYVNAGADQKLLLRTDPIHLTGDYFDSDGTITSAVWSKISGPSATLDQTNPKYLKLTGLAVGTYVFELRVTDNSGVQSFDQVTLQVLNTVGAEAAITDIKLINSNNSNQEVISLTEGMIINKNTLGFSEMNFKAFANSATISVRFSVNSDQFTSASNSPGPYFLKKSTQSWPIPNGDYTITVTPYKQTGARGAAGIGLTFKVKVVDEVVSSQTFYAKLNADISQLSSWGTNADGTGTAPTSFTANNQTFNITRAVSVDNPLTVSGTSSSLWVRNNGQLSINNGLTTSVNAEGNAIINISTSQPIIFGSLAATTTINFYGNVTIPAGTYGILNLKGSGTTKTLSSGSTQVAGDLIIDSGVTLNASSSNFSLAGNFTNSGTFTASTSTITFNGTGSQSISGATTFNKLIVSKSSGNITLSGTGPTTISSTLTLTTGHLISSSTNKLTLATGATISGGSATSFISGPVVKTIASAGTFIFPVGSTSPSQYRPTTLASTNALDTWTVEYKANDPSLDGYSRASYNPSTLSSISQFEYWNISRAGSARASLTLSYNTGSYTPPNIGNTANLRIAHWDGTKWDIPAGGGAISQSGNSTTGTVTVTNITSFSPFTLGVLDAPLPVKWLSFTATRVENNITLVYRTAQERNNEYFDIERSIDGVSFDVISKNPGAGTTNEPQRYQFEDTEVSDHITYYYRIKQVDYDDQFDFSEIIVVPAIGKSKARWAVWPNPITNSSTLKIELLDRSFDTTKSIKAKLIASNGALIFQSEGTLDKLTSQLMDLFSSINGGIYTLQLNDNTHQENFRIARF
jgi:predicted esterase